MKTLNVFISIDTAFGILLALQHGVGLVGNLWLFITYMYTVFHFHYKKSLDVILIHLTLASAITILFRGLPYVMLSFGMRDILEDIRYKAVLYIYRVTPGVCMSTSSLLRIFQAIIMSPSSSKRAVLKSQTSAETLSLLIYFWVSNVLVNLWSTISTVVTSNSTHNGLVYSLTYCKTKQFLYHNKMLFQTAMVIQDILFLFLIICTSLYMVSILFRHHKAVGHIHSTSLSPPSFPETKATCAILWLVSCFVFVFGTNLCCSMYIISKYENSPVLENITSFLSSCYPTICV